MQELDDQQLLREFAETNSESAFATLVARHVDLVYSTAVRFSGNPHRAEEITQAVFIILARKAGSLRRREVLSGWLYQTARLTAANVVKSEIRRQGREQEAYMQSTLNEPTAAAWEEIAPLLDDAMGRLGETDRNAVVMRYFENKTAREVAAALRVTEAAAHKRVNRALEKLRDIFRKRGVRSTTAILAGTISAHSVSGAPVALAKSLTPMALAKGAAASTSTSTLTLIEGGLKAMAWTKAKTVIVVTAGLLLVAGMTVVATRQTATVFQMRLVLDAPAADSEPMRYVTHNQNQTYTSVLNVQKTVLLDETSLESAKASTDPLGQPVIGITFTKSGAKRFADVTQQNIHKRLAIIIGGQICEAPIIQMEISGGAATIGGSFTEREAKDLAKKLNESLGRK
jgi:RNA polymerase sigma factor (sigma-70 family)